MTHALEDPGTNSVETLASLLHSRANAPEVLSAISEGSTRFSQIREATALKDMQIHRVLVWALRMGLVTRSGAEASPLYQLSGLGQVVVRSISLPGWVELASLVVRAIQKRRLDGSGSAAAADDVAAVAGVPPRLAERLVQILEPALRPGAESALARALHPNLGEGVRVLFAPGHDGCATPFGTDEAEDARLMAWGESLVARTLERAGVGHDALAFLPADDEPFRITLTQPVISVSAGNRVSGTLLQEYGVTLELQRELAQEDRGMLVRLFDDRSGVSHFVLCGSSAASTYAACRGFHDRVEALLDRAPTSSFAGAFRVPTVRGAMPEPEFLEILNTVAPEEDEVPAGLPVMAHASSDTFGSYRQGMPERRGPGQGRRRTDGAPLHV